MNCLAQLNCLSLAGVGPKLANYLMKCGVHTLQDLLLHLPYRYENRTQILPLRHIKLKLGSKVLVTGIIHSIQMRPRGNGCICKINDGTGDLKLRFFHLKRQQRQKFKLGLSLLCFGEIRQLKHFFEYEMPHPEFQLLQPNEKLVLPRHLTAIYTTTPGLTQRTWQKLIAQLFDLLAKTQPKNSINALKNNSLFPDFLSEVLIKNWQLPDLLSALYYLHTPPPNAPLHELAAVRHNTQKRLIIEELLAHFLSIKTLKKNRQHEKAPLLKGKNQLADPLLNQLPFPLTKAQQRVIKEINLDMQKPYPMRRLLQGDVGSGKTIVAAIAATQALANHYQVALMTPTQLLSEQHYQQFDHWLTPLGCHIACLKAKMSSKIKRKMLTDIEQGNAQIVIGTHALFQENVKFSNLGFIIIDEQHRFGVHQRLALWKKSQANDLQPHQLFMSATPIPRTLAMTSITELDISFLDELPPGRLPVQTLIISAQHRDKVIARVRNNCLKKKQAYWVCPLIDESDLLAFEAATTTLKRLKAHLPDLRLALVHGRLPADEKENIMRNFKAGNIDLLIATLVIEVGVDVANANLIIIENAERLGLAQLHQLRGRVGRSTIKSYCVLLYEKLSPLAKKRLSLIRQTHDGFLLAKHDLELRGPGEVYGLRQTGWQRLHIANLVRDYYLFPKVQNLQSKILQEYPKLIEPITQRWKKDLRSYHAKV
jgi:ATP-dependent DNA helicase RecG